MSVSPVSPRLARSLVLDELTDLTLYRSLMPVASSPDLRRVLEELIPVETKHFEFWRSFFKLPPEPLGALRRWKVRLLSAVCLVFGDGAIQLVLEGIEVHGIRKYLYVWERTKGTPLGDAVRQVLEDEMGHEDEIVLAGGKRRLDPGKVRGIFLGFNDGCVEILGAVSGFAAAFQDAGHVLMAAASVAVAGAISMAAGSYVALGSEREVSSMEAAKERFMEPQSAPGEPEGSLLAAAALVGISYFVGALVPVLPILLGARGLVFTVISAGAAIFLVSVVLSFLSGMDARRRVVINLVIIAAAVVVSSAIGHAARRLWGIDL